MPKKLRNRKSGTPVTFRPDKETEDALKIITRTLGRGNQSEGICRALISESARITNAKSMPSLTGQRELSDADRLYVELHTSQPTAAQFAAELDREKAQEATK